jgi:hypothetical protein
VKIQLIPALIVALALSLIGNAAALYFMGRTDAKAASAVQTAKDEATIEAQRLALETSSKLVAGGREDHEALLGDLALIAERSRKTRVVYRDAAVAAPLPVDCGPGTARMDAVNAHLGPATGD